MILESGTVHVSQGRTYDWEYFTVGRTTSKPFLQLLHENILQIKQDLKQRTACLFREAHRITFENYWDYPDLRGFLFKSFKKCENELQGYNKEYSNIKRSANECGCC